MKITIDGMIKVEGLPTELHRRVKQTLTLANPMYEKLKYMGNTRALYACPKTFKYYKEDPDTGALFIGRGMRDRLLDAVRTTGRPFELVDKTVRPAFDRPITSSIKLRDYQKGIYEEINPEQNREGILKLSVGFGKTILALELAHRLQTRSLFIVPRLNILEQFKQECKLFLSYEMGQITGKRMDIKDLTVATVQTLQRRPDLLRDLRYTFGLVVVDETHTIVPKKTRAVIESFSSRFLYGLSATPRRTDRQSEAIFFTIGPIRVERELPRAKPTVEIIPFYGQIKASFNYAEIIESQIGNEERNDLIVGIIRREIRDGRRVLCLTKRISHYEKLHRRLHKQTDKNRSGLPASTRIISLSSSQSAKERETLISGLRSGDTVFDCLLGTFSLLSTGFDCPTLDTLVLAGDLKSDVLQEQSAGRILRLFEGKADPKIIDIDDKRHKVLHRQALSRRRFYEEQGWKIIER